MKEMEIFLKCRGFSLSCGGLVFLVFTTVLAGASRMTLGRYNFGVKIHHVL